MPSKTIVDDFKQVPIENGSIMEFTLDPGQELSLRIVQDFTSLKPGGSCETYSLRFSSLRDVRVSLKFAQNPLMVETKDVEPAGDVQRQKYGQRSQVYSRDSWWFSLALSGGDLKVEAESFNFSVISRAEVDHLGPAE